MNIQQLSEYLCKEEKGKEQVNIAQMKEIVKVFAKLLFKKPQVLMTVLKYGERLSSKEKKK